MDVFITVIAAGVVVLNTRITDIYIPAVSVDCPAYIIIAYPFVAVFAFTEMFTKTLIADISPILYSGHFIVIVIAFTYITVNIIVIKATVADSYFIAVPVIDIMQVILVATRAATITYSPFTFFTVKTVACNFPTLNAKAGSTDSELLVVVLMVCSNADLSAEVRICPIFVSAET